MNFFKFRNSIFSNQSRKRRMDAATPRSYPIGVLTAIILASLLLVGCNRPELQEFSSTRRDPDDINYPKYADLSKASVTSDGQELTVAFEVYGFVPEKLPRGEDWHARAFLDTDSDDSPNYYVAYEVYPFDTRAKFYDYTAESQLASVHFPGTYTVGTNSVELSVPLEQLNYPADIRWYAVSEWNAYTLDSTRDWVPSDGDDRWINALTDQSGRDSRMRGKKLHDGSTGGVHSPLYNADNSSPEHRQRAHSSRHGQARMCCVVSVPR